MNFHPAVAATVAIVFATTVVSGPLVGAVDLTDSVTFSGDGLGEGAATVENVSFPSGAALERGEFGSGSYYLQVPDATVDVRGVEGGPILSYVVSIPALGFTGSSVEVLSHQDRGRHRLSLNERPFPPTDITADRYDAELEISVRYGGTEHVIETNNVTVEVGG